MTKHADYDLIIESLDSCLKYDSENYNALNKASDEMKSLYEIKLLGSIFLIAGVVCLLYFQFNQKNFIGSPAL